MDGIQHLQDLRLGGQPLSSSAARQMWTLLLSACRIGGRAAKLEGRLQFTFRCDASSLAAGAARIIQAHWRGMQFRRLMKCAPAPPSSHRAEHPSESLLRHGRVTDALIHSL